MFAIATNFLDKEGYFSRATMIQTTEFRRHSQFPAKCESKLHPATSHNNNNPFFCHPTPPHIETLSKRFGPDAILRNRKRNCRKVKRKEKKPDRVQLSTRLGRRTRRSRSPFFLMHLPATMPNGSSPVSALPALHRPPVRARPATLYCA